MRSAFCPATRLVRQWVKECQQPEGGELLADSCFLHGITQLGWPTLPQPRACTCAGFLVYTLRAVVHMSADMLTAGRVLQGKWRTWVC